MIRALLPFFFLAEKQIREKQKGSRNGSGGSSERKTNLPPRLGPLLLLLPLLEKRSMHREKIGIIRVEVVFLLASGTWNLFSRRWRRA
jgi:hypothetical protein